MRKIIKYFLISVVVCLATCLIVSLFFVRLIYKSISKNGNNFPPLIAQLLEKFNKPKPTEPILKPEDTIQIIEGWTSRDIGQYFEYNGRYMREEFMEVAGFPLVDYRENKIMPVPHDFSAAYSFLKDKPTYRGLEGYLFPDTYRIYATSTVTEVIDKMLSNFDKKLTPKMRADIASQGKTIYEIITLASIVEKEAPIDYQTSDDHDAKIIAGIFLNRLRSGQALQSDATISYIYGDNQPAHSGAELNIDSPYNTYKYKGLPPGPICNPGILAIEAAIYPITTDYYYFLTPKGKSEVVYAKTYDEHLQNKNKYLK
jgi:uncharacterized YceG family protein